MPVHVTRKRGDYWYAKGSVRVGKATVIVPEYSTGCAARDAAEHAASTRDAEIRAELLEGHSGRARRITVAECLTAYLTRPGGVKPWDIRRITELNEICGDMPLAEAESGWQRWLKARGSQKPSSVARWRTTLQAALTHGAKAAGVQAPKLSPVRGGSGEDSQRVIFLSTAERHRLLASYNPHAACPVLLLAYQGLRTQEALRLDWRFVDFSRRTIFIPAEEVKTGRGRTLPIHPKVDAMLFGLWNAQGKPERGPVFFSSKGAPYADTRGRGVREQGGNPLAQAHETACRLARIDNFRVHDWRHDWAARHVMAGTDLETLRRLGGWSSLRMVQRYASVSIDHMAEAVLRLI